MIGTAVTGAPKMFERGGIGAMLLPRLPTMLAGHQEPFAAVAAAASLSLEKDVAELGFASGRHSVPPPQCSLQVAQQRPRGERRHGQPRYNPALGPAGVVGDFQISACNEAHIGVVRLDKDVLAEVAMHHFWLAHGRGCEGTVHIDTSPLTVRKASIDGVG
ncbi:MAG TPA: hypothetical protein VFL97_01840 [Nitrococcus sp.]|nr:hypothetical protein [Nitrococcus sp.]